VEGEGGGEQATVRTMDAGVVDGVSSRLVYEDDDVE
jgi:hypothetical protein